MTIQDSIFEPSQAKQEQFKQEFRTSLNEVEQTFVDKPIDRTQPRNMPNDNVPKNKTRFMVGFNLGQALEGGLRRVTGDFDVTKMSACFQVGFVFGVIERRSGNIHDSESCGLRINHCWHLYLSGALPPLDTRLP